MPPQVDYTTLFLAVFALLVLSALTIDFCRRDKVAYFRGTRSYLFRGKTLAYSLAGNIGAIFSTTYFFGAVVIYAQTLNTWSLIPLTLACVGSYLLYVQLLSRMEHSLDPVTLAGQTDNILLAFLQEKYKGKPGHFSGLVNLYALIYLGLLTEELAVSKAVLKSMLPDQPITASLLLLVLCLVVLLYLYIGGFRAVLISDHVQVIVLASFVFMLSYYTVMGDQKSEALDFSIQMSPMILTSNIVTVVILGISWFIASLDFSARLNFDELKCENHILQRSLLLKLSMVSILVTLVVGVLFALATRHSLQPGQLPSEYLRDLTRVLLLESPRGFKLIFLVSVYSMIFTTIDTLLAALLQLGFYTQHKLIDRQNLAQVLLVVALLAFTLDEESLYVFGITVASLMVLPALAILRAIYPHQVRFLPGGPLYLWASLGGVTLLYICFASKLREHFAYQFLIPAIPMILALVLGMGQVMVARLRGRSD